METQEGIRTLRKILNDLTNLTDSTKSKEYKNVDIGFPIPFLKVILSFDHFSRWSYSLVLYKYVLNMKKI